MKSIIPEDEEKKDLLCKQSESREHHQSDDDDPAESSTPEHPTLSSRWFRLLLLILCCLVVLLFFIDRKELFHNNKSSTSKSSTLIPQDSQVKPSYSAEKLREQRLRLMLKYNFSAPSTINYTELVQELQLARVFTVPFGHQPNKLPPWCTNDPTHSEDEGGSLEFRAPYTSGLLYNKMPKAASSTLAGIVLRIAHNVAQRHGDSSKQTMTKCTSFQQHIENEGFVKRLFQGRDYTKSFLFSSVRDPAQQALSHIYFRHISRQHKHDNDKNMKRFLSDSSHQNGVVSDGQGGYQLTYLAFEIPPPRYAWNKKEPTKITRPFQVHNRIQAILAKYDFLVSVERFDESLVVLQLLLGLDTSDILYLSSKAAGSSYSYNIKDQSCFFLVKPNASDTIQRYLQSDHWYALQYGDYVLVEAVKQSLDLTIESLGKDRFEEALSKFRALHKKGEARCASEAQFPCSKDGTPQLEAAKESCYSSGENMTSDWGCGYACLDGLTDVP